MNNEAAVLKEAVDEINKNLDAVINKVDKGNIRDSAIMINDVLKGIDEIYVIIEGICGMNGNIIGNVNNAIEKVVSSYEKNNSVLIRLNVKKLKETILSINIE